MTMRAPNFLIIGAYRSGTTSLSRYLSQHPDIFLPSLQEPSYFAFGPSGQRPHFMPMGADDPFRKPRTTDLDEYLELFAGAGNEVSYIGECSPEYLREESSADRIHRFDPDMRLLVSLRDPVNRAISDYSMQRRDGTDRAPSFAAAVDAIPEAGPIGAHYLETGFYGRQLSNVLEYFPRDQVYVLIAERWQTDPSSALAGVVSWLGADPTYPFVVDHAQNPSGRPTNRLAATYFRSRARLAPLLGRRVPGAAKARLERATSSWLEPINVSAEVRAEVAATFSDDLAQLSGLLDDPLDCWPSRHPD